MFNDLSSGQVRAIGGGMAVFGNNHLKAVSQRTADCRIDTKFGGKASDYHLLHSKILKRCSQISIQEGVTRFLGQSQIGRLNIKTSIQFMA